MPRSKTPSHIVERRIYTTCDDELFIDKKMSSLNRMYNVGVRHVRKMLAQLYQDPEYIELLDAYNACKDKEDEKLEKSLCKKIFHAANKYGLSEYSLHQYLGVNKVKAYPGMNIDIVQKLGTSLYAAVKKCIFDTGKKVSFRKRGYTNSFEGKKANTGIIYRGDTVTVVGRTMKLKPVRESDEHMMLSLMGDVKYCRIARRNDRKHGYKYYLQIVISGEPVKKLIPGDRVIGIDDGTSTIAAYDGEKATFKEIAPEVKHFNKQIIRANRKYERRTKLANPDCYDENGTSIKGKKCTNWTNGRRLALLELKHAYRKKSEYVKQWHNRNVNETVRRGIHVRREHMNWKGLSRRAKETSRQDKASVVKKKDGTAREVHKFKKKKRFGSSINNRSPGYGQAQLAKRVAQYGGEVVEVNSVKYRASQYHHDTGEYVKPSLGKRTKEIDDHIVSRDLYSAFLLFHMETTNTIDTMGCIYDFDNFLICQEDVIQYISEVGDNTKTFGLREFISAQL